MKINIRHIFLTLVLASLTTISASANAATTKDELTTDSNQALATLLKTNPNAADLAKKAKEVLIFPNIVKAGLVFGGAYGEGVLEKGSTVDGFYNSVTASFGWQIGGQSYGYVVFLMTDKAVKYVHETQGWEIGTGPTIVVVNEGVAKNLSSTSLQKDAYAFIFDQQGLMASLSLEGTKISHIKNP